MLLLLLAAIVGGSSHSGKVVGLDGERCDEAAQLRAEGEGVVSARGRRAGGAGRAGCKQVLGAPGAVQQRVGAPEGVEAAEADEQDEADDEQDEAEEQEGGGGVRDVGLSRSRGDSRPPGGWWWPDGKPEKLRLWCSLGRGSRGKPRCSASRALKVRKSPEAPPDGAGRRSSALWMKWQRGP